jgi:hypothetical protein
MGVKLLRDVRRSRVSQSISQTTEVHLAMRASGAPDVPRPGHGALGTSTKRRWGHAAGLTDVRVPSCSPLGRVLLVFPKMYFVRGAQSLAFASDGLTCASGNAPRSE